MGDAAQIKAQYDHARLKALATAEGLKSLGNRIQCPARCSEDPRGATVDTVAGVALFHCQHGCGAKGSAIDLVALARGISVADALVALDARGAPPAPPPQRERKPIDAALAWTRLAGTDPPGVRYLESRGLGAAVERQLVRFNVGASGEWWIDNQAATYRVAVPLRDATGAVQSFQLRAISPPPDPKKSKLNVPGKIGGLCFGDPAGAARAPVVYLAEGLADTLAVQLAGVVVVGAPGVDQVKHLVQFLGVASGRTFVVCPQNDASHHKSEAAFAAIGRELRDVGGLVRQFVTPSPHKDPAELLQKVGLEAFTAAARSSAFGSPPSLNVVPFPTPEQRAGPIVFTPLTDTGNAERFVARHGADLRYCHPRETWSIWRGDRWQEDQVGEAMARAKDTVRAMSVEAAGVDNTDVRDAIVKWAKKSEAAGSRRALLSLACSEPGIPVLPQAFDTHPWLLNTPTGTLDLLTGEVREHRREDLLTKSTGVALDREAPCPRWEQFLEEVQPNPEIREFLQRLAGYFLCGVIREHVFPINYGDGRNGKGVYIDTLLHVLGDYGRQVPTELLMAKMGEAHPTERATLLGCRLAAAEETEEGRSLNVALVKQLTGAGKISARFMHGDFFEFEPTHKLLLSTNHRPNIKETKDAIWERVLLISWAVKVPEEKRDGSLKEKLKAEAPGILAWAIRGCMDWQAGGLSPPADVLAATRSYRDDMDVLADFFRDRCVVDLSNPSVKVRSSELLDAYNAWALKAHYPPLTAKRLAERLRERGFVAKPFEGITHWHGCGLRATDEQEQQARQERARYGEKEESDASI